jgi:hypothetical protein
MPLFQYVATPNPEETGGLFRGNGRSFPRKRAVYSEETGGGAKMPVARRPTSRSIPRKRAYPRKCSDQNCATPRIVVGAST